VVALYIKGWIFARLGKGYTLRCLFSHDSSRGSDCCKAARGGSRSSNSRQLVCSSHAGQKLGLDSHCVTSSLVELPSPVCKGLASRLDFGDDIPSMQESTDCDKDHLSWMVRDSTCSLLLVKSA
jgi:hypothetical protein